jgi:hypothetical protein
MKNPLPLVAALLTITPLFSQETATTESGKRVLLYADGTWKLQISAAPIDGKIQAGIPKLSTAKVLVCRGKASLSYDPKKWTLKSEEVSGRTKFEHSDGDAFGLIIAERTEIPWESLEMIAITNAKNAAPDAKIILKESKVVNGSNIQVIGLKGTIAGIKFRYYGYYVSGNFGTIQALTYTSENLYDEYKLDFVNFLNGLVVPQ